jgi:DNA-binding CsgD family transcriptional regulator
MERAERLLVGRATECAEIVRVLQPLHDGLGACLVLHGPPGVGKSALLEWTVAERDDCHVLRATGALRDMSEPFSLLEALFREAMSPDRASERDAGLGDLLTDDGQPVDRFQVAMAVFGLLSSFAESKPVLVAIDDAQWVDQSSLDALLLARLHLEGDAVGMLFARRDGEPCALDRVDLPMLPVDGLTPSAASELLRGVVSSPVALELAQYTDGNPLALLELAEALDADQRAGRAPLSPWLLSTPTVEAGFLRRVASLSPEARRVLEAASVDSTIEPGVLRALLGASALDPKPIDALVEQGFLCFDQHDRVLVFAHPLLRVAVYQAMPLDARRACHRQLAGMLRRDDDLPRRAWHLAGATEGTDHAVGEELARAGEYSQVRGAYAVAAETFERAASFTGDAAAQTRWLLAAGDAFWLAGHYDRSSAVLDSALALAPDQEQRADVQIKRIATQRAQSSSEMFDELTAEGDATEAVDPERAGVLFAQAVMAGIMGMRLDDALRSSERALALLGPAHPMHFLAQLLHALVINLMGRNGESLPVFRRFAATLDAVGPGPQFSGLAEYTALALLAADDHAMASKILDTMVDYARRERVLGLLALPLSARAELRWRFGDWAGARADATESFAILNKTEQYIERSHSLMVLAKIQGGVGNFDEARDYAREALALAAQMRSPTLHYMGSSAFGIVELAAGDFPAALRYLLECREYSLRSGDRQPTNWPWRSELVEVATRLGDNALASAVTARFMAEAEQDGTGQARAIAARCRGLVADTEQDARAAFGEALAYLDASPLVVERGRTSLLFGERLLEFGHDREAATHLQNALEIFDALGAHPWSARVRTHFWPGRPAPGPSPFEKLTDRELQIAVAVSTGKTSGEAAAELFLSRRTVEHHLASVYRKLDIRNRTQLAALFNRPTRQLGRPAAL